MPRTIEQVVTFRTTPERLYRLYLSPRPARGRLRGWARRRSRPGRAARMQMAPHITGTFLSLVPGKLIVQTWRGSDWKRSDLDSVLILPSPAASEAPAWPWSTRTSPTLTRGASRRAGTPTTGNLEEVPQTSPRLIRRSGRGSVIGWPWGVDRAATSLRAGMTERPLRDTPGIAADQKSGLREPWEASLRQAVMLHERGTSRGWSGPSALATRSRPRALVASTTTVPILPLWLAALEKLPSPRNIWSRKTELSTASTSGTSPHGRRPTASRSRFPAAPPDQARRRLRYFFQVASSRCASPL